PGRRGVGLGPGRSPRHGDGGRLCVRLDRPERPRGGGGRRQHDLPPAPQVLPPRAPSDADADTGPPAHADSATATTSATPAPAAGTEPAAAAAHPDRAARRAGAAPAPRGPPDASPGAADAPAATAEATARPDAGALRHAHATPVRDARALPGAPPGGPGRAAHPRRHIAAHLRPADHHARRGRRRRAAAALIRTPARPRPGRTPGPARAPSRTGGPLTRRLVLEAPLAGMACSHPRDAGRLRR